MGIVVQIIERADAELIRRPGAAGVAGGASGCESCHVPGEFSGAWQVLISPWSPAGPRRRTARTGRGFLRG